jgi:putative acetyltransferase
MTTFTIKEDDLSGPEIQALLTFHLREMHKNSPPGSVFALDLSGLRAPGVTVWSVWNGGAIAAIGALKELSPTTAEVKSMRTHPDHLRQGAAAHLLIHIVETARARGYRRLSLETGSGPAFAPALAMYRAHGFTPGGSVGDYQPNPFSQFFHKDLQP